MTIGRLNRIGQKFGKWTIIDYGTKGCSHWYCRCECGLEKHVQVGSLISGGSLCCANCKSNLIDRVGNRYGKLIVIGLAPKKHKLRTHWLCRCDCGKEVSIWSGSLERTKSCGCAISEAVIKRNTKHGYKTRKNQSRTYTTWLSMHARCKHKDRHKYWRHIEVCERWKFFENFLEDMGERPIGKTLDRIDNDKGYFKENCRWATAIEQRRNQKRYLKVSR